jgi:hypothetical protein
MTLPSGIVTRSNGPSGSGIEGSSAPDGRILPIPAFVPVAAYQVLIWSYLDIARALRADTEDPTFG